MKTVLIKKVSCLDNGCLAVFPKICEPNFQYIYREAAGVYWNEILFCFESNIPQKWTFQEWYSQIISVVYSGLNIRLLLTSDTLFESSAANFQIDILESNTEVQNWIDNNFSHAK